MLTGSKKHLPHRVSRDFSEMLYVNRIKQEAKDLVFMESSYVALTAAAISIIIQKKKKKTTVRKHLTGGFMCAVLDLSGILCSLLIPEYSGIKRRGKPLWGLRIQAFPSLVFLDSDKYPLPSCEPYGKSDCLQLSLSLIQIAYVLLSLEF